tara:strand:- start:898 stop:2079 length:1182 start_codon:yes stop_codon:yes gene_type:complete
MNTGILDPKFLKEKSFVIDPLADQLIEDIIKSEGLEAIKNLFSQLTDNSDIIKNTKVNPKVADYFNAEMSLPEWADPKQIEIAEGLFALYGLEICFLLNFRSLPLCYSSKSGSKVLYSTGRLREQGQNTSKMTRRLMETSQMIVNVMSPGGFDPMGNGIVSIKKVRLMHASIRYYLKHPHINQSGWDVDSLGEPINQEEMAGTLMSFGPLIMNGLDLLGVDVTKEQKDAYTHCWNIVGHFIGLNADLMPKDNEEGWRLGIEILSRNKEESIEGKALGKSIVQFGKDIFPGYFFDDMPAYFIKHFTRDVSKIVGVDFANIIGINPKPTLKRKFVAWLTTFVFDKMSDIQKRSWIISKISKWINIKLMQGLINYYLKNSKAQFDVPPSLKENWKI